MKIKFYRTSGYPPNPLLKEAKKKAMREGYDEVESRLGKFNSNGDNKDEWPKELTKLDQKLEDTFDRYEWRHVGSVDDIKELVKFYGTTLAFCFEPETETGEEIFTCYIMDNP